jgi:hypothetical protein
LPRRLQIAEKTLKRYCDGVNDAGHPVEEYERDRIEDMLNNAGVHFRELYPDHDADVELEPDVFCVTCEETTTPIEGVCPRCNSSSFLSEWDTRRSKAAPLHLNGLVAVDRAKFLREKYMMPYTQVAIVMGVYHGVVAETGANRVPPRRNRSLVNDGPV